MCYLINSFHVFITITDSSQSGANAYEARKELAGDGERGLHRRRACFETRPLGASQHEEVFDRINGIPHAEEAAERLSRRTHGADPADRQFLPSLYANPPCSLPQTLQSAPCCPNPVLGV